MKFIIAATVAGAAAAAATGPAPGMHRTNSYNHVEERDYPLEREGHVRKSTKTCLWEKDFNSRMTTQHLMEHKQSVRADGRAKGVSPISKRFVSDAPCVDGMAGEYPCSGIDLVSFVPLAELGSSREASDSWGWTDPETGDEIAIIVMEDTTTFVQVTDAKNPIVLGTLPQSGTFLRIWADVKVYANHAYIIREVDHGVQVFDLSTLRANYGVASAHVRTLEEEMVYREVSSVHNIVINEETAFAYAVGSTTCRGGLHAMDLSDPKKPTFAGCYDEDGYTHDAQVVIYNGPDERFQGAEIAFNFNEDTLTIVDVSNKGNMTMLSRTPYDRNMYTHQGWLTGDQRFIASNDELDESYAFNEADKYTRTLLWDVAKLDAPVLAGTHVAGVQSIDHNLYIKGDKVFASQYNSGLRILDASDILSGDAPELAFFDTAPYSDGVSFNGAWSNYPYFASGNVVVSNIETGLFMLKPTV